MRLQSGRSFTACEVVPALLAAQFCDSAAGKDRGKLQPPRLCMWGIGSGEAERYTRAPQHLQPLLARHEVPPATESRVHATDTHRQLLLLRSLTLCLLPAARHMAALPTAYSRNLQLTTAPAKRTLNDYCAGPMQVGNQSATKCSAAESSARWGQHPDSATSNGAAVDVCCGAWADRFCRGRLAGKPLHPFHQLELPGLY